MAYEAKLARVQNELTDRIQRWQSYKRLVKRSHWRRHLTPQEHLILSDCPAAHLTHLQRLEAFINLFSAKILYYNEIFLNSGYPNEFINEKREEIAAITARYSNLLTGPHANQTLEGPN